MNEYVDQEALTETIIELKKNIDDKNLLDIISHINGYVDQEALTETIIELSKIIDDENLLDIISHIVEINLMYNSIERG